LQSAAIEESGSVATIPGHWNPDWARFCRLPFDSILSLLSHTAFSILSGLRKPTHPRRRTLNQLASIVHTQPGRFLLKKIQRVRDGARCFFGSLVPPKITAAISLSLGILSAAIDATARQVPPRVSRRCRGHAADPLAEV
jgi:hypothetical protein